MDLVGDYVGFGHRKLFPLKLQQVATLPSIRLRSFGLAGKEKRDDSASRLSWNSPDEFQIWGGGSGAAICSVVGLLTAHRVISLPRKIWVAIGGMAGIGRRWGAMPRW